MRKQSAGQDITQAILSPRGNFLSIQEQKQLGKIPSMEEQKQREASAFMEAMRVTLNPLQKIVDSQDRTTEAVKKIPGAVAK